MEGLQSLKRNSMCPFLSNKKQATSQKLAYEAKFMKMLQKPARGMKT